LKTQFISPAASSQAHIKFKLKYNYLSSQPNWSYSFNYI